jgi:hypothetical protein
VDSQDNHHNQYRRHDTGLGQFPKITHAGVTPHSAVKPEKEKNYNFQRHHPEKKAADLFYVSLG